jgi:hypothetical protein
MVTRMVTRVNALLIFEFGAKTVAHAYTLIELIRMASSNLRTRLFTCWRCP